MQKPKITLLFVTFASQVISGDRIVQTSTGPVRGTTLSFSNTKVEAFLGIPYAEPPIDDQRFRKPTPISPWSEVYNAFEKPPPCYQNATKRYYWVPNIDIMSEDCLFLNIWVPGSVQDTDLKPIMIWIYGGAFNQGSTELETYDGTVLSVYGNIIVASLNYRVGVFGFLLSNSEDAAGNMGMYDQILALRWIKDNAEAFGGDPDQITLFGESAGAISIGLHLVSPMTQGLFKRAILESGGSIHPLATNAPEAMIQMSDTIAKLTGCSNDSATIISDPQLIIDCLKQLPPEVLSEAEGTMMKLNPITFFPRWGDKYMPKNPLEYIKNGIIKDTELLIGANRDEGAFFLTYILPEYFGILGANSIQSLSKTLTDIFITNIFRFTSETKTKEISNFYLSIMKNNSVNSRKKAIFDSLGDYMVLCPAVFLADFYSSWKKPVYFYMFTHRPSVTVMADWMGVTHYEEIQYVFGQPLKYDANYTFDEQEMSNRIMARWVTFAKTGNPNIPETQVWPEYSWENPVYLDLNSEEATHIAPDEERCEFWRERFDAEVDNIRADTSNSAAETSCLKHSLYITVTVLVFPLLIN